RDATPFGRELLPQQQPEEGRFARAARTGQEDEFSLVDAQRQIAHGVNASAVHLRDLLGFDHDSRKRRTLSFTRAGSALPAVAFMTCPTRNPNVFVFPERYSATVVECPASTSRTTRSIAAASSMRASP